MENEKKIYYSNATGVEMTNIDIKLKIDYITEKNKIRLCDIVLSPEQAKMTSIMLNKAIEEYEKRYRILNINGNFEQSEGEKTNGGKK